MVGVNACGARIGGPCTHRSIRAYMWCGRSSSDPNTPIDEHGVHNHRNDLPRVAVHVATPLPGSGRTSPDTVRDTYEVAGVVVPEGSPYPIQSTEH